MDETLRVPKKDRGVSRRETTVDTITTDGPVTITEETARQMHEAGIAHRPDEISIGTGNARAIDGKREDDSWGLLLNNQRLRHNQGQGRRWRFMKIDCVRIQTNVDILCGSDSLV
ncbi:hypothetical protein LTR41_005638 [Exophiala xenobiotica]|nr:hypothetical protein LTR41_005638 [Exophiala xenobiotica]